METTYQPKALSADELNQLSREVKQTLTELYGERLDRVILYGSYARGDFHAESDVDYMVVLNDEAVQAGQEIWFFGDRASELTDRFGAFVLRHEVCLAPTLSGKDHLPRKIQPC